MQYITIIDYILLPLYICFFYLFIKARSIKYKSTGLDKFLVTGFFLHMAGSVLYCMIIQYYYGYGDSFGFFNGSNFLRKIIHTDGQPISTFLMSGSDFSAKFALTPDSDFILPTGIETNSNLVVMKVSALLSYVSFNSYLIVSLFFGMFAFAGSWKLFTIFNEHNGGKNSKLLAYTILFLPSICFWGSGLIKDSLCLGALGLIVYAIYILFFKKRYSIKHLALLLVMFYFLFQLKSYIAGTLVAAMVLGYVVQLLGKSKRNPIKLIFVVLILLIGTVTMLVMLSSTVSSLIEESKEQIDIFKNSYADVDDDRSQGSFASGDINDISVSGFILRSPLAIFTTLFRPFLWEARKPIMLFSALESFLLLLGTLYLLFKSKVRGFFYYIFSDPVIFFAFAFTLFLSAIVGFTTFNFGTLVRYRLPILPFYCFALTTIYTRNKEKPDLK